MEEALKRQYDEYVDKINAGEYLTDSEFEHFMYLRDVKAQDDRENDLYEFNIFYKKYIEGKSYNEIDPSDWAYYSFMYRKINDKY